MAVLATASILCYTCTFFVDKDITLIQPLYIDISKSVNSLTQKGIKFITDYPLL